MPLERLGGLAALTCAATYLVGFALLAAYLAPLGYGTARIDAQATVGFIHEHPAIMLAWNSTIYIVNALALAVLVVALKARMATGHAPYADLSMAFGLIWAALVLGAGMLANVAVEQATQLFAADPALAAERWQALHSIELGLGGGNEIAGGVWILSVSLAGGLSGALARIPRWLGIATGASGLATIVPALGEVTGAVFGLGAIVWFLVIGWTLTRPGSTARPRAA